METKFDVQKFFWKPSAASPRQRISAVNLQNAAGQSDKIRLFDYLGELKRSWLISLTWPIWEKR